MQQVNLDKQHAIDLFNICFYVLFCVRKVIVPLHLRTDVKGLKTSSWILTKQTRVLDQSCELNS